MPMSAESRPVFNSVSAGTYVRYLEQGEQRFFLVVFYLDHMTDSVRAGCGDREPMNIIQAYTKNHIENITGNYLPTREPLAGLALWADIVCYVR